MYVQVSLYVDGQLVIADRDNTEVLDDWPLHPSDRVHFTKLVIGACWKGNGCHWSMSADHQPLVASIPEVVTSCHEGQWEIKTNGKICFDYFDMYIYWVGVLNM